MSAEESSSALGEVFSAIFELVRFTFSYSFLRALLIMFTGRSIRGSWVDFQGGLGTLFIQAFRFARAWKDVQKYGRGKEMGEGVVFLLGI